MELAVRSGSIDSRFSGTKRALQGTILHQRLQKRHKKEAALHGLEYESEVTVKHGFSFCGCDYMLMGRIDGLVKTENRIIIEEIKSTTAALDETEEPLTLRHIAQARLYAYMYAEETGNKDIGICLTYCDLRGREKSLFYDQSFEELRDFFFEIMETYRKWSEKSRELIEKRDESLSSLRFPFEDFRKGQRELSVAVYKTLVSGKKLFAAAPTGIGKTMGTLFPALKYMALSGEKPKRLFYLTPKNTVKALAEDSLSIMTKKGLFVISVTLVAKEKACLNTETRCNPTSCPYADGHFDRVNDALWEILCSENIITADIIRCYAEKYRVCPFELSLDLTDFAHIIICDYNYAFDPSAKLSRFFDEDRREEYIALVDEAHNLPDRSRDMYSAEFKKSEVLEAKRALRDFSGHRIIKVLNKLNTYMLREKAAVAGEAVSAHRDEDFIYLLSDFVGAADSWLMKNEGSSAYDTILQLYFKAMDYIKIDEYFDKRFVIIKESYDREFKKTIFCRDPSEILKNLQESFGSMVFFTATLRPMEYFIEILGGSIKKDNRIEIPSPFPRENLCVITDNSVSTVYRDREKSIAPIAERIYTLQKAKKGNYICFFPSYEYMERVYGAFCEMYGDVRTIIQSRSFTEKNRRDFLDEFMPESAMVGFCVLGGVFSEGIDLKGDRLIGCAIVGVGLPKISVRQNVIKEYFDSEGLDGFARGYAYPGMIKAAQAGGRVIRSETDRGVILLLDRRFSSPFYRELLPLHWRRGFSAFGSKGIETVLKGFWK